MPSVFRLYSAAGSGGVAVEAALALLAIPCEIIETPTWEGEAERQAVAAVNPMRQIPALVTPDGEVITESAAILIWLADSRPESGLSPALTTPSRAQFLRWMIYIPAAIYAMYWVRDEPSRLAGDDPAQQALIKDRTAQRIADCWAMMDDQIGPGPYVLGDAMTVLDLYVAVVSRWTPGRARFAEVAPRLASVVRRVDADPRLADLWARRFDFPPDWQG